MLHRAQTGAGPAHVSCEIPNLRCNMDCERPEFPRQLLAGDIDERVSLEQRRQAESIRIRTTGKYRTLVREQRPGEEERTPHTALG